VLQIQPITFREACLYVQRHHRHHRPPQGSIFQVACNDGLKIVGVLIAGRPVSRELDNGTTLEVTRCCTDSSANVCSMLYGHAWKAAKALGWSKLITYTLPDEGGSSLRASGAVCVSKIKGHKWSRENRPRADDHPLCDKWRWEWNATPTTRIRLTRDTKALPTLF